MLPPSLLHVLFNQSINVTSVAICYLDKHLETYLDHTTFHIYEYIYLVHKCAGVIAVPACHNPQLFIARAVVLVQRACLLHASSFVAHEPHARQTMMHGANMPVEPAPPLWQ
jgi:hypothetical protein